MNRPSPSGHADHEASQSVDRDEELPAFLEDEGPSSDLPAFVNTTNIRELYDWKPGESLTSAIDRKKVHR